MSIMDKHMKHTISRIDIRTKEIVEQVHAIRLEVAESIRKGYNSKPHSYGEISEYKND